MAIFFSGYRECPHAVKLRHGKIRQNYVGLIVLKCASKFDFRLNAFTLTSEPGPFEFSQSEFCVV
jgi:hypothetical protein